MVSLLCPVALDISKTLSFHGATGVSVTVWDCPYAALSNIPLLVVTQSSLFLLYSLVFVEDARMAQLKLKGCCFL